MHEVLAQVSSDSVGEFEEAASKETPDPLDLQDRPRPSWQLTVKAQHGARRHWRPHPPQQVGKVLSQEMGKQLSPSFAMNSGVA